MSDNQVIPEAAVEAAVQASYRRNDWGDESRRKFIERALEAAAPHMLPLGPHPTWGSEVSPANNAHIAFCPQCQETFG